MTEVRLQKYIADQNIASRREAERYIQKGLVRVNGEVVTALGTKVNPAYDQVDVNTTGEESKTILAYYKPRGVVTNCPQDGEVEITDKLPPKYQKLNSIGRLDKDSEGLILMTDDGVFAKNCLQSSSPHERVYEVKVSKALTPEMRQQIEDGMPLKEGVTLPTKLKIISDRHFLITLKEGKNRQIRRMIQKVGSGVIFLKRLSFGPYKLGDLKPNQWRVEGALT